MQNHDRHKSTNQRCAPVSDLSRRISSNKHGDVKHLCSLSVEAAVPGGNPLAVGSCGSCNSKFEKTAFQVMQFMQVLG